MSKHSAGPPAGGDDLIRILDELRDLFRRRLLDDRDKRLLVEELHDRVRRAEEGVALEYLLPLIFRIMLAVDRLDDYSGADPDFVASVREEMLLAFSQHGIESIDALGPVDPAFHEVVDVQGGDRTGTELLVGRVIQRGYRYGGRLLRPARVSAVPAGEPSLPENGTGLPQR
ncbi:nucleotide exchange factor GrpE [Actinomadura sp. DC4]|uniref:nucleotide exchange factor GrpE n=1 Tax=Actinomadura sp. DC4 TaxID=3055069 RepID=UPI0025B219C9|nr:nucleotide exchange factor GrpE [Actinomadura sp. DC4]MDN3353874.1 nucleotide exchange factor GrpE [Actinomadura sp. DC4]